MDITSLVDIADSSCMVFIHICTIVCKCSYRNRHNTMNYLCLFPILAQPSRKVLIFYMVKAIILYHFLWSLFPLWVLHNRSTISFWFFMTTPKDNNNDIAKHFKSFLQALLLKILSICTGENIGIS